MAMAALTQMTAIQLPLNHPMLPQMETGPPIRQETAEIMTSLQTSIEQSMTSQSRVTIARIQSRLLMQQGSHQT